MKQLSYHNLKHPLESLVTHLSITCNCGRQQNAANKGMSSAKQVEKIPYESGCCRPIRKSTSKIPLLEIYSEVVCARTELIGEAQGHLRAQPSHTFRIQVSCQQWILHQLLIVLCRRTPRA